MPKVMHELSHAQLLTCLIKLSVLGVLGANDKNKRVRNDFKKSVTCHPCKMLGSTLILSNEVSYKPCSYERNLCVGS